MLGRLSTIYVSADDAPRQLDKFAKLKHLLQADCSLLKEHTTAPFASYGVLAEKQQSTQEQ